eukprot:COSAG06_NODE_14236_length_1176_cov_1.348189_3_plen_200_part_01
MWSCVEWQAGRQVGGLGAPRVPAAGRQTGQGQIASISERADHRRRSRQTDGPTELPSWSLLIDTCIGINPGAATPLLLLHEGSSLLLKTTAAQVCMQEQRNVPDLRASDKLQPMKIFLLRSAFYLTDALCHSMEVTNCWLGQKPNPLLPHYISLGGMYTGGGTLRDSLPLYLIEAVGFAPPPPTSSPDDCDGRIVCRKTC